jgi:hypothetical protein
MSDPVRSFRELNGVPLLGSAPPAEPERRRVLYDVEYQPDAVPVSSRERRLLKTLLRWLRARCKGSLQLPLDAPPLAQLVGLESTDVAPPTPEKPRKGRKQGE